MSILDSGFLLGFCSAVLMATAYVWFRFDKPRMDSWDLEQLRKIVWRVLDEEGKRELNFDEGLVAQKLTHRIYYAGFRRTRHSKKDRRVYAPATLEERE